MTTPEIIVSKRIVGAVYALLDEGEFLPVDFLKWNAVFRNALCEPFGRIMDDLFGLNQVYSESYHWFLFTTLTTRI